MKRVFSLIFNAWIAVVIACQPIGQSRDSSVLQPGDEIGGMIYHRHIRCASTPGILFSRPTRRSRHVGRLPGSFLAQAGDRAHSWFGRSGFANLRLDSAGLGTLLGRTTIGLGGFWCISLRCARFGAESFPCSGSLPRGQGPGCDPHKSVAWRAHLVR